MTTVRSVNGRVQGTKTTDGALISSSRRDTKGLNVVSEKMIKETRIWEGWVAQKAV